MMSDLSIMLLVLSIIILMLLIPYLLAGINIIPEWQRAPVLRLGRYIGLRGPGIFYLLPGIYKIPVKMDLRIQTVAVQPQSTMTKDNVPVNVDVIIYYKIKDPEKAILKVANYANATEYAAQTILRDVIGKKNLDEILGERGEVGNKIKISLDEMTENYGVEVLNVEIRDVTIPAMLQDAMARQAQAERERRARVLFAEAERQAASIMLAASKIYEEDPVALQLRWMNILYEVSKENATIMIVPANMITAGPGMGNIVGLASLVPPKEKEGKKRFEKE